MLESQIKISVIIPIYRDWGQLALCLEALSKQTYPKELFEVIVVNNDPNDHPPADFVLQPNCQLVSEQKPGSYAARNAGLKIAKGEIIGFTDADCIPGKDWIKNAVDYFTNNKSCSRVAGCISIIQKSSRPSIVENYNKVYSFPQRWLINNGGGSVTANLFVYRKVFDRVGYFDENLLSMGDKHWGMLAEKAGYKVEYADEVIVYHPPRNLAELIKKEKRHGGAIKLEFDQSRLIYFLYFLYEFRPRLSGITFMFGKTKGLRIIDRITIPFLRHFLLLVRAYEKLRIRIGKQPNRA